MRRGVISASSFKAIDAFGKTLEDVKIRTRTGAFLTFASIGLIVLLTLIELIDWRTIYLDTDIEVNKERREYVTANLNITFPRVPCFLLSLDATDLSGEHMRDIAHNVVKRRINSDGVPYPDQEVISDLQNEVSKMSKIGKEGYCGSCFGGLEPPNGCCQSCEDVRKSYVDRGWAFTNPEAIEQCQREGWTEKIQAQSMDGCEISGRVRLKKTASSLIFSFGQSFQLNSYHTHELVPYLKDDSMIHDFGHYIHHLRFESDDEYDPKRSAVVDKIKNRLGVEKNPMDNTYMHHRNYMRMVRKNTPNTQQFMIQYFVKVVNSEFGTLDGQHISSYQYTFNSHHRNVGEDVHVKNEEGIETTHGFDARPGVFFNIDVSPMQIIHTEKRKPFAHFLTTFCAIIGGVLTVASLIDSALYNTIGKSEADRR